MTAYPDTTLICEVDLIEETDNTDDDGEILCLEWNPALGIEPAHLAALTAITNSSQRMSVSLRCFHIDDRVTFQAN